VAALRVQRTKWVGTLYPTDAAAQDAGMSLGDFERFVFDAMFLYDDDPVARWGELRAMQARLIERLAQRRRGPHRRPRHRPPDVGEGSLLGELRRTQEHAVRRGLHGPPRGQRRRRRLSSTCRAAWAAWSSGACACASRRGGSSRPARPRARTCSKRSSKPTPGARYLGELGIGTNYRIGRPILNTLFDEKIGGTVHLALGSSYPATGGTNVSAIHWDLITDLRQGGELLLDGEPFQRDGRFLD
jgi:aminopeptidase